jgi:hypothetical protein
VTYAEEKENRLYFVGNASKHGNFKMTLSVVISIALALVSINYSNKLKQRKYTAQKMFQNGEHAFIVRQL